MESGSGCKGVSKSWVYMASLRPEGLPGQNLMGSYERNIPEGLGLVYVGMKM